METISIKELTSQTDILEAFPVMKQLRTHLDLDMYLDLIMDAQENERYKLFALFKDDKIVAVTGFKPMITLYYGRFVWVCDLVTDQSMRSKGYGEKLLTFVHTWADQHHYQSVALSSGLQREDAHRFYEEKMNYEKVSFVFKTTLTKE